MSSYGPQLLLGAGLGRDWIEKSLLWRELEKRQEGFKHYAGAVFWGRTSVNEILNQVCKHH